MYSAHINNPNVYFLDLQRTRKILARYHYPIRHIEGYDLLCSQRKDLPSSIIERNIKEFCTGTMNSYFIRYLQNQNGILGISWLSPVLHQILNADCWCSIYQLCQITKKERKKYRVRPPKILESDCWFMGDGLSGSTCLRHIFVFFSLI
jgi:hypothetical protein